jgi:hypothetical protein
LATSAEPAGLNNDGSIERANGPLRYRHLRMVRSPDGRAARQHDVRDDPAAAAGRLPVRRRQRRKMRRLREFADWADANLVPLVTEPWHLIAISTFVAGVGVGMIISGIAVVAR